MKITDLFFPGLEYNNKQIDTWTFLLQNYVFSHVQNMPISAYYDGTFGGKKQKAL